MLCDSLPIIERHLDYRQVIVSAAVIVALLILLFIKLNFGNYFKNLFQSLFHGDLSTRLTDRSRPLNNKMQNIFLVAAVVSHACTLFVIVAYHPKLSLKANISNLTLFAACLAVVSFYMLYVRLVMTLIGNIFSAHKFAAMYCKAKIDIFNIASILLLACVVFFPFMTANIRFIMAIYLIVIVLASYVVQAVIYFFYSVKIKFFHLHTFLYFCAVEIIPVLYLMNFFDRFLIV